MVIWKELSYFDDEFFQRQEFKGDVGHFGCRVQRVELQLKRSGCGSEFCWLRYGIEHFMKNTSRAFAARCPQWLQSKSRE